MRTRSARRSGSWGSRWGRSEADCVLRVACSVTQRAARTIHHAPHFTLRYSSTCCSTFSTTTAPCATRATSAPMAAKQVFHRLSCSGMFGSRKPRKHAKITKAEALLFAPFAPFRAFRGPKPLHLPPSGSLVRFVVHVFGRVRRSQAQICLLVSWAVECCCDVASVYLTVYSSSHFCKFSGKGSGSMGDRAPVTRPTGPRLFHCRTTNGRWVL